MTKDEALSAKHEGATTVALKMALEALEYIEHNYMSLPAPAEKAITAIREALAQPEQEPVAWMSKDADIVYTSIQVDGCFQHDHIPLYTTPPQRKPLSMQERTSIVRANTSFHDKNEIDVYGIIDDVEAAHGIKGEA